MPFRVFTFDEARFGNVAGLARRARSSGVRLVAIVDPAVRRDEAFALYREGVEGDHFVRDAQGRVEHGTVWPGWAAFPDFTRAATRAWWQPKYATLTSTRGSQGVWHDMNEPTSITLWGDRTLPRAAVHDLDGRGADHAEAHNLYGLYMDRVGYEALAVEGRAPLRALPSGWASLARWAWHWTADVESSIEGLAQQVPTFLGLGLSSVPFTGSDLGGFTGIPSPGLYVRWLELGVVSPFCRTHCVLGAPGSRAVAVPRALRRRDRAADPPPLPAAAAPVPARRGGAPARAPAAAADGLAAAGVGYVVGRRRDHVPPRRRAARVPVADPDATTATFDVPPGAGAACGSARRSTGRWRPRTTSTAATVAELDAPLGQPLVLQRAGTVVVLDDGWIEETTHARRLATPPFAGRCTSTSTTPARARARVTTTTGDGDGPTRHDAYVAATDDGTVVVTWTQRGSFERAGPVGVVLHGARRARRCGRRHDARDATSPATAPPCAWTAPSSAWSFGSPDHAEPDGPRLAAWTRPASSTRRRHRSTSSAARSASPTRPPAAARRSASTSSCSTASAAAASSATSTPSTVATPSVVQALASSRPGGTRAARIADPEAVAVAYLDAARDYARRTFKETDDAPCVLAAAELVVAAAPAGRWPLVDGYRRFELPRDAVATRVPARRDAARAARRRVRRGGRRPRDHARRVALPQQRRRLRALRLRVRRRTGGHRRARRAAGARRGPHDRAPRRDLRRARRRASRRRSSTGVRELAATADVDVEDVAD